MSPLYKCRDCGFKWDDVQVDENESNFFLRCLRCESRNISFPTNLKKLKFIRQLILWTIFSIFTGILGAGIGYVICAFLQGNNCWQLSLVGFLIGLLIPLFIFFKFGPEDVLNNED
jgi:hypothetical protein